MYKNFDFFIKFFKLVLFEDMIIVADTKVARRVGEYFIKHIIKLQEVTQKVKAMMPPVQAGSA